MQPDMQTLLAGARSFVKKAAQTAVKTAADNGMLQQLLDGGRSLVSKVDLKNPMHTGAIGAGVFVEMAGSLRFAGQGSF